MFSSMTFAVVAPSFLVRLSQPKSLWLIYSPCGAALARASRPPGLSCTRTRLDEIPEAQPTISPTIRLPDAQSALGRAAAATSEPALSGASLSRASHAADPCLWTIALTNPLLSPLHRCTAELGLCVSAGACCCGEAPGRCPTSASSLELNQVRAQLNLTVT